MVMAGELKRNYMRLYMRRRRSNNVRPADVQNFGENDLTGGVWVSRIGYMEEKIPEILKTDGAGNEKWRKYRGVSIYDSGKHPGIAAKLSACGFSQKDLGWVLGVSQQAVSLWIRDHPEFRDAVECGRSSSVKFLVAQALREALGYEYEEAKEKYDSEGNLLSREVQKKYHHPDNFILTFLMINWSKGEYRNTKYIETKSESKNVNITGSLDVLGELEASEIRKLSGRLASLADKRESSQLADNSGDTGRFLVGDTPVAGGEPRIQG